MKFYEKFTTRSNELKSLLCLGLDPEWEKLPVSVKSSDKPLFTFCKEIVDATQDRVVSYNPNICLFVRFGF